MFSIVQSVGSLVKTTDHGKIDGEIFRLHYTFTVGILLGFFIIVTTEQFIGDPIVCDHDRESISEDVIQTYCWIHATYVVPSAFHKKVGVEVPHPGIDSTQDATKFRYLRYYQWIYFMLFFQAVLFYIPRWLWRMWEGGRMESMKKEMSNALLHESEMKQKVRSLTKYLFKTWRVQNPFAMKYFFCEFLALVNVVGQIFLLNRFFDGEFLTYGYDVVKFFYFQTPDITYNVTQGARADPMTMLFPRVTKCIFRKFGRTSLIEVQDVLCIMAMNVINEKIYLFMWFWMYLLAILTGITVIGNLCMVFSSGIRTYSLSTRFHFADESDFQILVRKGSFGNWFLLDMIGQNLDSVIFKDLVSDLAKEFEENYKHV